MKQLSKNHFRFKCLYMVPIMFCFSLSHAGEIDSTDPVTSPSTAMHTLDAIYNALITGVEGSKRTTLFAEPTSAPTPTKFTLNEIMTAAPRPENNAATPANVSNGKLYWSLSPNDWGPQTGTR